MWNMLIKIPFHIFITQLFSNNWILLTKINTFRHNYSSFLPPFSSLLLDHPLIAKTLIFSWNFICLNLWFSNLSSCPQCRKFQAEEAEHKRQLALHLEDEETNPKPAPFPKAARDSVQAMYVLVLCYCNCIVFVWNRYLFKLSQVVCSPTSRAWGREWQGESGQ